MFDELLKEVGIDVYLHNKTTPLAIIYVPRFSLAHYLKEIVSSYFPFCLASPSFEELFEGEVYEDKHAVALIYNDPLEEGYPIDLGYEERYGDIIIVREEDYPEIKLELGKGQGKRKKKNYAKSQNPENQKKKGDNIKLLLLNIFVIGLLAFAFYKGLAPMVIGVAAILLLAFDFVYLNSDKWAKNKEFAILEREFAEIFSYFSIFIKNGFPSYSALENILPFASEKMKGRITNLLAEIDEDKTVMPYIHFGENFKSLEIKQVLIAIFKMSEEGGSEAYIRQFDTLFRALSNNERRSGIDKKKSRLDTLGIMPLLGSGLAMIIIIMAVVILLQEMGNYGF